MCSAGAVQLEHSSASNDNVEGSRLQQIRYGYAASKREDSFISENTCFPCVSFCSRAATNTFYSDQSAEYFHEMSKL